MIRSSFSILFFIRDSKVNKEEKAPIEVKITVNGNKCNFSTGKQILSHKVCLISSKKGPTLACQPRSL